MLRVGLRKRLVAIRLPRLREQDQRRRIGRLQAERQIEQDEWIEIELHDAGQVQPDPEQHDDRLRDQKDRRPEEARKGLRLRGEPIVTEGRLQVRVRQMKSKVMADRGGFSSRRLGGGRVYAHWFPRYTMPAESGNPLPDEPERLIALAADSTRFSWRFSSRSVSR